MKTFAAFVLALGVNGKYSGTTRDKGNSPVGLPGGKVDKGENPAAAAIREASEEGWNVKLISNKPIQTKILNGKKIVWFSAVAISKRKNYKEKKRGIRPIWISRKQIVKTKMGNDSLFLNK